MHLLATAAPAASLSCASPMGCSRTGRCQPAWPWRTSAARQAPPLGTATWAVRCWGCRSPCTWWTVARAAAGRPNSQGCSLSWWARAHVPHAMVFWGRVFQGLFQHRSAPKTAMW